MRMRSSKACRTSGDFGNEAEVWTPCCGAAANWTQFCDRDVDRYMAEGAQTLDEGQRHQSYLQAHRRLQEQAYVGSGYTVPKNFGLGKNVRGVGFQLHWLDMNRLWLE